MKQAQWVLQRGRTGQQLVGLSGAIQSNPFNFDYGNAPRRWLRRPSDPTAARMAAHYGPRMEVKPPI